MNSRQRWPIHDRIFAFAAGAVWLLAIGLSSVYVVGIYLEQSGSQVEQVAQAVPNPPPSASVIASAAPSSETIRPAAGTTPTRAAAPDVTALVVVSSTMAPTTGKSTPSLTPPRPAGTSNLTARSPAAITATNPGPTFTPSPTLEDTDEPTATDGPTETPEPTDTAEPPTEVPSITPTRTSTPEFTPGPSSTPATCAGRVAFSTNRDGNYEIYVLNIGVGVLTRVTQDSADDLSPAWSPGAAAIAWIRAQSADAHLVVRAGPDGASPMLITHTGVADGLAWSPDGQVIVFGLNTDGFYQLFLMNASDGGGQQLLTTGDYWDAFQPAWSPDGAQIAYVSLQNDTRDLYVRSSSPGGGENNLTATLVASDESDPVWSPNGNQIAFTSVDEDGFGDIYVINSDLSGLPLNLTRSPSIDDRGPAWSPDGQCLAFASGPSLQDHDLFVMNADGSSPRSLEGTQSAANEIGPAWGP